MTSDTDTGLSNGTYYYYVVSSVSTAESADSAEEFGLPGAKTYTWSPTAASDSWSTASNWVEGVVPTSPALLVFGASTTTTLNNDLPGLEVARFTFDADAGAYTIGGNAITLGTEIMNNSNELQSIQLPMTVNRFVNSNANAGRITDSVISGPGGFVTRGPEATAFLGPNTFSGGITAYGTSAGQLTATRNLSFSGVGTPSAGPFGNGRVTLHQADLSDTLPIAAPNTRNVLYNEIYVVEGTKNVLFTRGAVDWIFVENSWAVVRSKAWVGTLLGIPTPARPTSSAITLASRERSSPLRAAAGNACSSGHPPPAARKPGSASAETSAPPSPSMARPSASASCPEPAP